MGNSYDLDLNVIDIDDWRSFVDNNEEIEEALNVCCSNVADMIANATAVASSILAVNSAFLELESVSVETIPEADDLVTKVNEINDYIKDKALIIVAGINYAELAVKAFNSGIAIDDETSQLLSKILQRVADSNVYWLVSKLLSKTPFKGIGFCLAYGTDAIQEGGTFVVGDAAVELFQAGMQNFFKIDTPPLWANAAVGSVVVALFTAGCDYFGDKGEMTQLDWERLGLDAAFAGLSYAEWVAIAGSIGGPAGVVVAGLVAIPTSMLFNAIKDAVTGDNIIHTFEIDGVTYEVPANGNGEDGTFDVLVERYGSVNKDYYMGDRLCSASEYKETLYKDLPDFIYKNTGERVGDFGEYYSADTLMAALDELAKADTFEEGMDAYYAYLADQIDGVDADIIGTNLMVEFGFNFEEYYNYNHGG